VHTETSDHRFFLPLCRKYPEVRFQWAHAGGLLGPEQVGALLAGCANVWVDFAARDPWKYIRSQIVDENGHLLPGWLALIQRYPDRFMIGSDPVWPIENRNPWDEADTGWDMLAELIQFHHRWLAELPPELAQKLRVENARRFYAYALKPSP
jgi:predicted TIM-barrel fold metal-dependent hydrolase